jgi:Zn finger protein HypA/HybF involved in hydrogenase expression
VHELSLAMEVCRIAREHVGTERTGALLEVGVEVGDESGVERGSFEFCLEALLAAPPFGRARPVIQRTAGDALRLHYLEVEDGDP